MNLYLIILIVVILIRFLITPRKETTKKSSKKHYGIVSQTIHGHPVRSKGEKQIADFLASQGIAYLYEPKLGPYRPDFYLPDYKLIIEYYGMANVQDREGDRYRIKMVEKTRYYKKNNVYILGIMPSHMKNGEFKRMISHYLK